MRPERCVSPRSDALDRLRATHAVSRAEQLELATTADDLDGDGHSEILVEIVPARGATGNSTYLLYLGGPRCRRYAGEIFAQSMQPARATHCGVRDLETYSRGGCAGLAGTGEVLVFDGARYQPSASFECECPVDAPGAPRDPRCPPAAE